MEKPYFRIVAPPVRAAFQTKAVTPVTDAQLTETSFFAACASDKNSPEQKCSGEFLSIKMQRSAPPNQGIVPNIRRCARYFGYVRAAVFSASVLFEFQPACIKPVSYTHLDVYKRQPALPTELQRRSRFCGKKMATRRGLEPLTSSVTG